MNLCKRGRKTRCAMALLLSLCLAGMTAQAGAMPPGAVVLEAPQTDGIFSMCGVEALPGGGFVIGGQIRYADAQRIPYGGASYPDETYMTERTEAIAMQVGADGSIGWTIRVGDPQADNTFAPRGVLPDGRILLHFLAMDSSFGDHYYIVTPEGVVDEMLPFWAMAEHYAPMTMRLLPETGYLGGDSTTVDDYYDRWMMREDAYALDSYSRVMTLLDFDMQVVWQRDFTALGDGIGNYEAVEGPDGIYLLGQESVRQPETGLLGDAVTSVLKLDKQTGETIWQLTDTPRDSGAHGARDALVLEDGGLLFCGAYLAEGESLADENLLATLTRLDAEGNPLWTRRYDDLGVRAIFEVLPMRDGYVMQAIMREAFDTILLLHVDAEGEVLGTLTLAEAEGELPGWAWMARGEDGTVVLVGTVMERYDPEETYRGAVLRSYIAAVDESSFTPVVGE